jgi:hypothetical protein
VLIKVYCNADENGVINNCLAGPDVIVFVNGDVQYKYYFETNDQDIMLFPERFSVINGILIKSEF